MKNYLIGAAGVIFLSVIVTLFIPEGRLNKTVTFVMRLVCIFVLIRPVTEVFTFNSDGGNSVDYDYVAEVYSSHQSRQLEKLLEDKFGEGITCTVTVGYSETGFEVSGAEVITEEKSSEVIDEIYEYLKDLGYINITVYATGA